MAKQNHKKGKAIRREVAAGVLQAATQAAALAGEVRKGFGMPRRTFARLTGLSERTLAGLESGQVPSEPGRRRLRELERLYERLGRVVQPEFISQWLETPNEALEGLKPLEVIERGEMDRIWSMLFYLESGTPT